MAGSDGYDNRDVVKGEPYTDCGGGDEWIPAAYNFPYGSESWFHGFIAASCCEDQALM